MTIHALIPLKDLSGAKTRLAGVLSASERHALALAMAEDVLAALAGHRAIAGVTLLSDDPVAHLLAGAYGARHMPESSLGCRGLNAVVTAATRSLAESGAQRLLVAHADLPLLGEDDIERALQRQASCGGLLIGTDRAARGSNLLLFDARRPPQFLFGADSCARHRDWSRAAGLACAVLHSPGIALDVDRPQDLAVLLRCNTGGHTGRLLQQWPRQRLQLALASLAGLDDYRTTAERNT